MPDIARDLIVARYTNTNNIGIAIVALLTRDRTDDLFEWAAYIGASTPPERIRDTVEATCRSGNKLTLTDAQHYFPNLPIERYRE